MLFSLKYFIQLQDQIVSLIPFGLEVKSIINVP